MSYYLPHRSIKRDDSLEQNLARVLMKATSDAVVIADISGCIKDANNVASQLIGWSIPQMKDQAFAEVFHFVDEVNPNKTINLLEQDPRLTPFPNQKRVLLIGQNNTEYTLRNTVLPLFDSSGSRIGTVVILTDITKLKNLGLQILWHCDHDAITGLDNRFSFEEKLSQAIELVKLRHQTCVLCHIDIDQFKLLNDICGSSAGDQLLGQIAILLSEQMRPEDTLARIGGDEFGILFSRCTLDQAYAIATDIQQQVTQFQFLWKGKRISVGVSMGLVPIEAPSLTVDVLLQQSETACLIAKTKGQKQIQIFALDDKEILELRHHQEWSVLIRDALKKDRFCLYRQPIVPSTQIHESPHHFEVLVRMLSESNTIIAPNSFISTAERYQLMPAVDQWIIEHCLVHLEAKFQNQTQASVPLTVHSINLSGTSFGDDQFLDYLLNRVTQLKMPQHSLCFEITETAAISDIYRTKEFVRALRGLGCAFSLDDFGSGMSSFGYLKHIPVDYLKIDGDFIRNIEADLVNYSIVESISTIGQTLHLKTIAEQVESQAALKCLQTIGVNFIQGFAIGKPELWF